MVLGRHWLLLLLVLVLVALLHHLLGFGLVLLGRLGGGRTQRLVVLRQHDRQARPLELEVDLALCDVAQGVEQLEPPVLASFKLARLLLLLQLSEPRHRLVHHAHDRLLELPVLLRHEVELRLQQVQVS